MRKSSYPSLENCNIIANKIFGISLAELQQEGQPDHEVPFIVRHIVNYIEVHGGLEQEGLFQVNGNAETVEWLRQRYDNGEEVDLVKEADVPSAISLLRYFLQELPQPIILHSLHHRFMQLSQDFDNENEFSRKLQYLLQQLPSINYSLLKFLCRFLANVASNHEEMWPTTALAAVFGPDLFHIYSDDDMKEQEIVTKIMTGLLERYCDYFETEEEFSSNNISSITEQNNDLQKDFKEENAEVTSEECFEVIEEPSVIKVDISEDLLELNDVIASTSQDISVDNANIESDDTEYSEPLSSSFSEYQDTENSVFSNLAQEQTQVSDILLEITDEQTNDDGVTDKDFFIESDRLDKTNDDYYRPHSPAMDSSNCDYNANLEFETLQAGVSAKHEAMSIHHLQLRNISSDDLEEPFPDFKSWQQDLEYGEAQLSPQAGRMNYYVEEDTTPVRSHRSLDFGQSQRFLHNPESDCASMTFYIRTRKASFIARDEKREDKTPYQLVKKLHKKIRQYEEQFETEKSIKPTYNDIAGNPRVLKWMTDLTKLKRQIKDAKHKNLDDEFLPQIRPRSNTLPKSFGSSLEHEEQDETKADKKPSQEATLELILKRLQENRSEKGLPEKINMKMTKDNLAEEKTSLQKSLLYYESLHGRPVTREERQIVKPLYDRYRLVKQMLARATITPILGSPSLKRRAQILPPIIEGETSNFFDDIKQEEEDENSSLFSDSGDNTCITEQKQDETPFVKHQVKVSRDRLSSSRTTSMTELLEQLWKTKAEKKKLRQSLREFEEEFHQQNGRNVQKDDRAPMLEVYREYKKVKAKLRLLEVLISKQDYAKSY